MVMTAGPSRTAGPDELSREYEIHLSHARHYLRKALEAEATEASGVLASLMKAQVEQNAAILCALQSTQIMLALVIGLLTDEAPEEADDYPDEAAGGEVQ